MLKRTVADMVMAANQHVFLSKYGRMMANVGFFLVLATIKVVLTFRHEPWRDETVLPLMWQDANYMDMIPLNRGIVFPLYDSVLLTIYRIFGYSVFVGRCISLGISIVTSYMILFSLDLPRGVAFPLLLTNYLFYDYTVFINRHYAWIALLIAIFTYLEIHNKPLIGRLLVISLLILGHPLAFVVGGSYLAYLILAQDARMLKKWINVAGLILVVACVILAVWAMIPPYEGHIAPFRFPGAGQIVGSEVSFLSGAFFGITRNWESYRYGQLSAGFLLISLGVVISLLASMSVQRSARKQVLAIVVGLTVVIAGMSSVFIFRYGGGIRHLGLLYLTTLSYVWIAYKTVEIRFAISPSLLGCVWALSCGCLIVGSAFVSAKDLVRPFSNGTRVADYLKQQGMDQRVVTVVPDWVGPPIAVHLDRPQFYAGGNWRINDWTIHDPYRDSVYKKMSTEDMLAVIPSEILGRDPVIILNENLGPSIDVGPGGYKLIAWFEGGIVYDENYYVYDSVAGRRKESWQK